jgi:hypothetical protein
MQKHFGGGAKEKTKSIRRSRRGIEDCLIVCVLVCILGICCCFFRSWAFPVSGFSADR